MPGPHQDNGVPWSPKTTTTTTNQVSPGHPGGGYNPNLNQIPSSTTTNQNVKTGIVQTTTDPYDEKGDYMDWDYVNPDTGKTAGQMLAEAELAAKTKENDRIARMKEALELKDKYGDNINKWSDKDLLKAQSAGLFTNEAEGVLGGVTEYEKQTNLLKKAVNSKVNKMRDQGLTEAQFKNALMNLPEFKSLAKLHGYKGSMERIFNPTNTASGSIGNWILSNTTQPEPGATGLGAVGYDPSGTTTWADTESNPELEESYYALTGGDLSADDLRKHLTSIGYDDIMPQEGGFNFRPRMSQRERNARLLQFLNAGLPIKQLEQSGFMSSMKDPYASDQAKALQEGIFKGAIPGGAFTPEAMKRLIKTFASGYSSPRYANVARGGIMSAWNDMRR
tara:strand:+ start:1935 stop:3110 length:1176 start_codon:yes stop_codon:yes gene_type:complete